MSFYETLGKMWAKNNSLVCVGLDPDLSRIPDHLSGAKNPIFEFNRGIVDATADLVCAYKPQFAHYAAEGAETQLAMTIDYIHKTYPGVPVILDVKRGDIGSTAKMYAKEAFDRYGADALTVNPFLGGDSLTPFLENKDKGVVILCRTSNPGARDIQDLEVNGKKLYQVIAYKASYEWNYNSNVLLVVGATYPKELKEIRYIVGDIPLLVPGIGAQGGDTEAAVRNGLDSNGAGMIINSSRGIIYAGTGKNFADAARQAAEALRDEINRYR
ncbi:MAG: orotidine-5'-phosphate decarboxylase [Deltaproteobacteria bacterium]|nr:orotidine-5'-phosphate decarboxylase [Deltaproteobacteria bacterium]MBW2137530.1 orotidine-5'-phosphate decarboxylase [Deltaproteobacteria bacterium]